MPNARKKFKTFISFAAIILSLILFSAAARSSFFGDSLLAMVAPFSRSGIAMSDAVADSFRTVAGIKNLIFENADLKKENRDLFGRLVQYDDLAKENELLRSQLGVMASDSRFSLLSGEIVSFDPVDFSDSMIIDKGLANGVSVGMPVIMPGNIVLGKISESHSSRSTVALISDKANKVNVISERAQVSGVLNGSAGGALLMDLIEKDATLEEGDLILTSGLDGVYPKNLIVGRVTKIIASNGGIFKQAYVKPAYAEFRNNLIFVVTNYLK